MENFVKHDGPPGLEGMYKEGTAIEQFVGAANFWHQEAIKWKRRAVMSRASWFCFGVAVTGVGGAIASWLR